MPTNGDAGLILPLRCPKCGHHQATLFVNSVSVLTVQCVQCAHPWSTEIAKLSVDVQRILPKAS